MIRAQRRQMFGYPAAFVNGHLFAGLHQSNLVCIPDTRPAPVRPARGERSMKRHAFAVLGYLVATFATQARSHFLIFLSLARCQ
jgi:hypothetical protein